MNCKPGDLAVIVRSECGNEGKIVRCLYPVFGARLMSPDGSLKVTDAWRVEATFLSWNGEKPVRFISDYKLRPLRDNDGEDETLTWAGKPEGVPA